MDSDAIISPCQTYRYLLRRIWNPAGRHLVFVMLNPSTASASTDDPTIRRCMRFAGKNGYGGILVVNLFAFRATDPARLPADESAIGPENDRYLTAIAQEPTGDIIVAWGTKGSFLGRDAAVLSLLAPRPLWCLGVTAEGFPRHPLYVRGDIPFTPYERAGQARTAVCG